ncbi:hypothetical protein ACWD04_33215, partial [Streptomyces sp. NPDC002911]
RRIRRLPSHQDTLPRICKIHCQRVHTTGVASAGDVPAEHIEGIALVGELGFDGEVRLPHGIPGTLRALAASAECGPRPTSAEKRSGWPSPRSTASATGRRPRSPGAGWTSSAWKPPPYEIEETTAVTLVITPEVIAHLRHEERVEPGQPKRYRVVAPHGTEEFVITDGDQVGVLHIRCACNPDIATQFETEADVLAYTRKELNAWWTCEKSPSAPAGGEDQAATGSPDPVADALYVRCEDAHGEAKRARAAALTAAAAYAAHLIRKYVPTAAVLTVDVTNGTLRAVLDGERRTLWYAPASPIGLHDGVIEDVEGVMRDVLEFGAHERAFEQAGWQNPGAYDDTYDLALPEVQQ